MLLTNVAIFIGHYIKPGIPRDGASYNLRLNDSTYRLTAAVSGAAQHKGLGGREQLSEDQGMLFWYSRDGGRCFWMEGMQFPLDIIWTDSAKQIVHMEQNLSPDTYPKTYCTNAQYVIELNAGVAAKHQLHLGQRLSF